MLHSLHLLRVVAALGVVYFHITSDAGLALDWDIGSRGVDVFFVISGFIIAYIGSAKPEKFFLRRVLRVVPFYWAATLVVFAAAALLPHLFRTTDADPVRLLCSLLFIPLQSPDGGMWPTLVLGWSLNYEMFFYVLFALALGVSPRWAPAITVSWIVALFLVINGVASESPTLGFYARPIVLEFCLGVLVFYLFRWADGRRDALARIAAGKVVLLVVFVVANVALVLFEHYYKETISRALIAGLPGFAIVLSALLLERIYGVTTKNQTVFLLGEASYIIYLVHPYIVFTLLRVGRLDGSLPSPVLAAVIVGLIVVTAVVSVAIHLWFEKPLMGWLRARLGA